MKKIIFWLTMIVGIIAVIGACKKSDDSTTTTAAACSSSLSTTASGTLTGLTTTMGVDNVTGTYSMSWKGATPTAGCIDNATPVSLMISYNSIPSDSQNFKFQIIVTSSTSFTELYIIIQTTILALPSQGTMLHLTRMSQLEIMSPQTTLMLIPGRHTAPKLVIRTPVLWQKE